MWREPHTCQPREKFSRDKRWPVVQSEVRFGRGGGLGVLPWNFQKKCIANGAIWVIPELYLSIQLGLYCNKSIKRKLKNYNMFSALNMSENSWMSLYIWFIPSFVEPFSSPIKLAWHALSWWRRTSVRPPDDIEKWHTDYTAPCHNNVRQLSYPSKIFPPILINSHFFSASFFSTGAPPSHVAPLIWKTTRANYPKNTGDESMPSFSIFSCSL